PPSANIPTPSRARMFNWFSPKCPVQPETKLWVEQVITWIIGEFGLERLRRAKIVLPLPELFPDPVDGSQDAARALFERVCRYMDVDPDTVDLEFFHSPERDHDVVYVGPYRLPARGCGRIRLSAQPDGAHSH